MNSFPNRLHDTHTCLFLRFFFFMCTILKVSIAFAHCFCFRLWHFQPQGVWKLSPCPEMEPAPPALGGEVVTTGLPGNSPAPTSLLFSPARSLGARKRTRNLSKGIQTSSSIVYKNNYAFFEQSKKHPIQFSSVQLLSRV